MNALLKALALVAVGLASGAALAGEAVPVNATFGIQWTPQNWTGDPQDPANFADGYFTQWVTTTEGAAGLANGKVLAIQSIDTLRPLQGTIDGQLVLWFSYADAIVASYTGTAGFDEQSGAAAYSGPVTVVGGWGRFEGATGALTIASRILFFPYVGTLDIKGVIKTAN